MSDVKVSCQIIADTEITGVGSYLEVLNDFCKTDVEYWFRGQRDASWRITPSALRYVDPKDRNKALDLLPRFRRIAESRLPQSHHLDTSERELRWLQLAQHYGLPTRLVDWTRNAALGLYFATLSGDQDGAVFILDPKELNGKAYPGRYGVLTWDADKPILRPYFSLRGDLQSEKEGALRTIAIEPTWDSERIILQDGCFTLHGSIRLYLDKTDAPSLMCIVIPGQVKRKLRKELARLGTAEMHAFPEPEHICRHLIWEARLDVAKVR